MSGYKEFEGKSLDDAIHDACAFYDTAREKLEIEILNDARSGIFGLVGAKKARIRARVVQQIGNVLDGLVSGENGLGGRKNRKPRHEDNGRNGAEARGAAPTRDRVHGRASGCEPCSERCEREPKQPRPERSRHTQPRAGRPAAAADACPGTVAPQTRDAHEAPVSGPRETAPEGERGGRGHRAREGREPRPRHNREKAGLAPGTDAPDAMDNDVDVTDMEQDNLRRMPLDQLDQAELRTAVKEVVTRLTAPILGEAPIEVTMAEDRVCVSITGVDDPGLLIGRDGQTLAALQYLATRMVSSRMKALLRIQIDAGDYRERQDARLRDMALSLAEKVKAGGRPQVTRPLSSYHRRVVHLALQGDPLIQTHSKGEGEMKRVMIARRKQDRNG